jgi:hypothetical protein
MRRGKTPHGSALLFRQIPCRGAESPAACRLSVRRASRPPSGRWGRRNGVALPERPARRARRPPPPKTAAAARHPGFAGARSESCAPRPRHGTTQTFGPPRPPPDEAPRDRAASKPQRPAASASTNAPKNPHDQASRTPPRSARLRSCIPRRAQPETSAARCANRGDMPVFGRGGRPARRAGRSGEATPLGQPQRPEGG